MKTDDIIQGNHIGADKNGEAKRLDPDHLIGLFRKYEKKQSMTRRLVVGINIVLFILYASLASGQTGKTATGYLLCGIGFVMGAAYLYFRYRPLPANTYTLPIMDFLRKTEKRLRYFTGIDYFIVIPILVLIGTGGGLIFISRLSQYSNNEGMLIVIWILFFTGLCLFGYFAGRKTWQKENSAVHNAVKETLNSMNGDSVI